VQIIGSWSTNHATKHQLVVVLPIGTQSIVVVLANCHIFDFDTNRFGLIGDQFCGGVPVGVGVNASQSEGEAFAIFLEDTIRALRVASAGKILLSFGGISGGGE